MVGAFIKYVSLAYRDRKALGDKHSFNTDITDGDELNEIEKIEKILNTEEKVLLVAEGIKIDAGWLNFNTKYCHSN